MLLPTQIIVTKICGCIRSGKPLKVCANYAGLSESRVQSWMRKGQEENADPLFERFASEVFTARAEGQMKLLEKIEAAAENDWRAADRLIKLTDPDMDSETKQASKVEVSHHHEVDVALPSGALVDVLSLLASHRRDVIDVEEVAELES
jgi:hypothetical protein